MDLGISLPYATAIATSGCASLIADSAFASSLFGAMVGMLFSDAKSATGDA